VAWVCGGTAGAAEPANVDAVRAAKAEVVLRGTAQPIHVEGTARGGWPQFRLTVTAVLKTPADRPVKPGDVVTLKTLQALPKVEATYYLRHDADQGLYRLRDEDRLDESISHVSEPPKRP
jgi:hypothetical protein